MYHRAQIKREVKQAIATVKPRPMWIALFYMVVASAGASLIQTILSSLSGASTVTSMLSDLIYSGQNIEKALGELLLLYSGQLRTFVGTLISTALASSILVTLWQGLMDVGFSGYCLALVRGDKATPGKIFCGFHMAGKVVITSMLVWIFGALWTLLWAVCLIAVIVIAALLMQAVPVAGVLLIVVGYIGFMALLLWTYFRYAMTNYILLDTGRFGMDAIAESKRMMKGNKWKFFVLHLSFIGWYLLMYAVILVGCAIIGVVVGAEFSGIEAGASNGSMVAGMFGISAFVLMIVFAVTWLISIWLKPFVTGTVARFYLAHKPAEPVDPLFEPLSVPEVTEWSSEKPIDPENPSDPE